MREPIVCLAILLLCLSFSARRDGEARFTDEISELKKELAERDETIIKLKKAISACEEVSKHKCNEYSSLTIV